jgi:hypothetical protein
VSVGAERGTRGQNEKLVDLECLLFVRLTFVNLFKERKERER